MTPANLKLGIARDVHAVVAEAVAAGWPGMGPHSRPLVLLRRIGTWPPDAMFAFRGLISEEGLGSSASVPVIAMWRGAAGNVKPWEEQVGKAGWITFAPMGFFTREDDEDVLAFTWTMLQKPPSFEAFYAMREHDGEWVRLARKVTNGRPPTSRTSSSRSARCRAWAAARSSAATTPPGSRRTRRRTWSRERDRSRDAPSGAGGGAAEGPAPAHRGARRAQGARVARGGARVDQGTRAQAGFPLQGKERTLDEFLRLAAAAGLCQVRGGAWDDETTFWMPEHAREVYASVAGITSHRDLQDAAARIASMLRRGPPLSPLMQASTELASLSSVNSARRLTGQIVERLDDHDVAGALTWVGGGAARRGRPGPLEAALERARRRIALRIATDRTRSCSRTTSSARVRSSRCVS